MQAYPYAITPHEPTKKQLWLASFTSLLARLSPEEAIREADRALDLCDERWRDPEYVTTWEYAHNHAVGHHFDPAASAEDEVVP